MSKPEERISKQSMDVGEFNKGRLLEMFPVFRTEGGGYNPDWAIVLEAGEVVYLVRETKGGRDLSKLQFPTERMKILYGVKHFDAVGADYDWLEKASEVEPKSRVKRKSCQLISF